MLDSMGALGLKNPAAKPAVPRVHRRVGRLLPSAFERPIPFDPGFRMEDDSFYCLELTEKAFRSQGLGSPPSLSDRRLGVPGELSPDRLAVPRLSPEWCWTRRSHWSRQFTSPATSGMECGRLHCSNPSSPRTQGVSGRKPCRARQIEPAGGSGSPRLHVLRGRRSYADFPPDCSATWCFARVGEPVAGEPGRPSRLPSVKPPRPPGSNPIIETPESGNVHLTVWEAPVPIRSPGVRR